MLSNEKLDVLTTKVAFSLRESRKLVDHTVADVQCIQSSILNVNPESEWSTSTIDRMLSNEKYVGEVRMQKTFTADFLTGIPSFHTYKKLYRNLLLSIPLLKQHVKYYFRK